MAAQLRSCHLQGDARPGGRLLEDHGQALSLQWLAVAAPPGPEGLGALQQLQDLLSGEIGYGYEIHSSPQLRILARSSDMGVTLPSAGETAALMLLMQGTPPSPTASETS